MKKAFIAATLVLSSVAAHAEFWTGTQLIQELEDDQRGSSEYRTAVASGYVIGVTDSYSGILHCMPAGTSVKQVKQVVFNYMKNNPQMWDKSADQNVLAALKATWPCAKR